MTLDRRQILFASGAVAGAAALAACSGSGSSSSSSAPASSSAAPESSSAAPSPSPSGTTAPSPSGTVLANVADVPVGGGIIVEAGSGAYAVTQPEAGSFRCFSAICTHQGCTLNSVENGLLGCPCHGGQFTIDSGTPAGGPPKAPLADEDIEVVGDTIVLA